MKTSTSCSCQSAPDLCATGVIERPCYYPGQLLTPAEMTLEQQYFRDKLRRHNRLLHGWGVVCGAAVCRIPVEQAARDDRLRPPSTEPNPPSNQPAAARAQPWKVRVTPGYILGPYGDEILIDREQIIDLRTCGQTGVTGEHGEPPDPFCVDVYIQRDPGLLYVAVRYQEVKTRPVRVQPAGCGCDETQCVDSRCRDGYEICVLTDCPPSHENLPNLDDLLHFKGALPDCPECPADPWVVLARVEVEANGTITVLDNCSCRRLVASFGHYWWQCMGDACAIQSVKVEGGRTVEVDEDFVITVKAYDLPNQVKVDLGHRVTVKNNPITPDAEGRLRIEAKAEANAEPGPRTLEIKDLTGNLIAARRDVVVIRAAGAAPAPPPGGGTLQPPAPPADKPAPESQPKPARGKGKGGEK